MNTLSDIVIENSASTLPFKLVLLDMYMYRQSTIRGEGDKIHVAMCLGNLT